MGLNSRWHVRVLSGLFNWTDAIFLLPSDRQTGGIQVNATVPTNLIYNNETLIQRYINPSLPIYISLKIRSL